MNKEAGRGFSVLNKGTTGTIFITSLVWRWSKPTSVRIIGKFACGPASVNALVNGRCDISYDAPYIFAEVNADRVHWGRHKDGTWAIIGIDKGAYVFVIPIYFFIPRLNFIIKICWPKCFAVFILINTCTTDCNSNVDSKVNYIFCFLNSW